MHIGVPLSLPGVLFLVFTVAASGQPRVQTTIKTQPSIDGAKEPHRIPDEIAALMLFRTIADGPSFANYNTRVAFLKQSEFTDQELQILVDTATQVVYRIRGAEAEAKNRRYQMKEEQFVLLLRRERDSIVREALQQLNLKLSPAAAARLSRHIAERVKPWILVFDQPE